MKISDRFVMALRNLSRRKSRTILTVLSVVIGATSIILMLAFAEGISASQRQMIESFQGLTTINIYDDMGSLDITDRMLREIKAIDHVKAVVPSKNVFAQITVTDTDEYELDGSLNVIPDDVLKIIDDSMFEWGKAPSLTDEDKIILGPNTYVMKLTKHGNDTYFDQATDFDFSAHQYQIRLGYQMEDPNDDGVNFGNDNLNPDENIENKPDYIDIPIEIAGKLNRGTFLSGWGSYISESTYNMLKKEDAKLSSPSLGIDWDKDGNPIKDDGKIKYDNLSVVVDDPENVNAVESAINQLGYQTNSMADATKEIEGQSRTVMLILGGIGSIAFIVSAIGIINTMLMSIYERQKEIGVMKVIGASISDIQTMFLIESGFIGFFGGILGLLISLLIANAINGLFQGGDNFLGASKIVIIPVWLMILGVGFSALVGVLAGYIPARRATKLSAIEALRAN